MTTTDLARTDRLQLAAFALGAALLIVASYWLPVWTMKLDAPQYPNSLYLRAYGSRVAGDLYEINIINHYVGMEEIAETPAPEMALFPYAIWSLAALCVGSIFSRRVMMLALMGTIAMPIVTLADLQWWLHRFGQNLDPKAPLRFIEPFTPLAIGISKIGNFETTAMVSYGFFAWGLAAALLYFGLKVWRRRNPQSQPASVSATQAAAALVVMLAAPAAGASQDRAWRQPQSASERAGVETRAVSTGDLQARIDNAADGDTLRVDPGTYRGPLTIRRPLTLEGVGRPLIIGDGVVSVITVSGDDVTVRGLAIRRSGRDISAEAAGIKAEGDRHVFRDNVIDDVYFGIHLANGADNVLADNVIRPGVRDGVRPGHAISLWYQTGTRITNNETSAARDGVYLSFADDVLVENNTLAGGRYGVHSMYSRRSTFIGNDVTGNLLGAALMYSDGLAMRCNRIERHREGATAYGVLLKDIDDLVLEHNELIGNRVGIYADNTPLGRDKQALVTENLIAGNGVALALQSTARLTFTGNQVVDNLISVRTEGGDLEGRNTWSVDGRGNYWDDYAGFDRDGDGVGEQPYRYEAVMNELIRRQPMVRAFLYTPAHMAIEAAARMFPVFRPAALLVDEHPLIERPAWRCPEVSA